MLHVLTIRISFIINTESQRETVIYLPSHCCLISRDKEVNYKMLFMEQLIGFFGSKEMDAFIAQWGLLLNGAFVSLQIFVLTLLFSLPLGLFVALGRMSAKKWLSKPLEIYILIMRGTPLLLQIMFIYFAPYYIFGKSYYGRFAAVIIAFSINYAAYFAEIYRGGIESIPHGQYEAASVLGFTKFQAFTRIILPQVIKRIIPAVGNEVITLVKDTALANIIGVSELFRVTKNETNRTATVTAFFYAGIIYLALNWIVTKILNSLEKKFGYYK